MLVVSRPDLAVVCVRGSDRVTWLNGLLTCDLTKAKVGTATYGLAVTIKGRILADVIVILLEDEARLVVPAARRVSLLETLDKHLIMEDVELSAADDPVAFACGPEWRSLAGSSRLVVEYDSLTSLTSPPAPLPHGRGEEKGRGGAVVIGKLDGIASGDFGEWDALRVERGVPRFGVDFDETTYPQEASLEKRAVSFDKGCYLGQEVVCMLELRGHVKRKLVPVSIDSAEPPPAGSKVTDESGAEVGVLTSAAVGPESRRTVGLAMVKLAKAEAGTKLAVGGTALQVR